MEQLKQRAAKKAVESVTDGDVVGLGSGSTAAFAIRELAERAIEIKGVPTSFQARKIAIDEGISVVDLDQVEAIDIAIDGADQVGDNNIIVKGGGAAHTREKIVDSAAERLEIIVDESKMVSTPDYPVPVEVLPSARSVVYERIRQLGGTPSLRIADEKSGPVITDNGNMILDCAFGEIQQPRKLAKKLSALPGVLEHGLFIEMADQIIIGTENGVETRAP
ncbi:ribose-5-phosphate isomerase RpiA [Salinarchaeum sp. IM2453]|uniref:ribose-5-phosphate isomerase RpiA n=1 Tax=Salinarchaeum sp. IM2453 TaxID=2862870 RepID=UPI001C83CAFF|nr:ribose-5-phosphate isomerase RpiA [Salinarchaeum sp. IM2453]QZA89297.1 ribose-5-phosphate isomerase RpiA [Salinarchaeum sp. IM2453]